jgi:hypothetical protein
VRVAGVGLIPVLASAFYFAVQIIQEVTQILFLVGGVAELIQEGAGVWGGGEEVGDV